MLNNLRCLVALIYDNSINEANKPPHDKIARLVTVVIFISSLEIRILSNRYLNTLRSKSFAQRRTLANPGKFLGRVNIKYFAEAGRQYGSPSGIHS